MKKDLTDQKNNPTDEPVVIPDECGDSMWDEVLGQEINVCEVKQGPGNTTALLKEIKFSEESRQSEKETATGIKSQGL